MRVSFPAGEPSGRRRLGTSVPLADATESSPYPSVRTQSVCELSDGPSPPYPSVRALRAMHLAAAGTHVVSFALAMACTTSTRIGTPIWTESISYGLGATPGYVQFGDRKTIFTFYQQRVLLAFVGVTALFHCFYATLAGAGADGNLYRWAEYSATATMLTLNAGVGVGASSIDAFIFLLALSIMLQGSGLGLDLIYQRQVNGMRELLLGSGFASCTALVIVLSWHTHLAENALVDTRRIASAYGAYFFSFGIAAVLRAYSVGLWRSAAWTEFVYVILSLSSKTSVFWLSFGGIRQMVEHLNADEPSNGVDWAFVQLVAAIVPGVLALFGILLGVMYAPRKGSG